jgi:hypothetical protein
MSSSAVSEPTTTGQSELPPPSGPATPPYASGSTQPATRSLTFALRTPTCASDSNVTSASSAPAAPQEHRDPRRPPTEPVYWIDSSPLGLVDNRWAIEDRCSLCRRSVPTDQLLAHAPSPRSHPRPAKVSYEDMSPKANPRQRPTFSRPLGVNKLREVLRYRGGACKDIRSRRSGVAARLCSALSAVRVPGLMDFAYRLVGADDT